MVVAHLQANRKVMEQENEKLKIELKRIKEMNEQQVDDKRKYMEGAVWMGRKITSEVEKVCQGFEVLA